MNSKLEIKTREEIAVWKNMQAELKRLQSHSVRKTYYPHRLDTLEDLYKKTEADYRAQIYSLIQERHERTMKENELVAAEALLLLKNSKPIVKRSKKRSKLSSKLSSKMNGVVERRSKRIAGIREQADREKCWGCIENQPNQLAHVGPNGCLGDDDYFY